jgi:hypothetical protein
MAGLTANLHPAANLWQAMRVRLSNLSCDRGRRRRLLVPATVTASTLALAMPLALPTLALARSSVRPRVAIHRIVLHAAKVTWHGHGTFRSSPADLTALAQLSGSSARTLTAVSVSHRYERARPSASARGPPDVASRTPARRETSERVSPGRRP